MSTRRAQKKKMIMMASIVYVMIAGAFSVWTTTQLTFVGFQMTEYEEEYIEHDGKLGDLESRYFTILFDELEERAGAHGLIAADQARYISPDTVLGFANSRE